MSVLIYDAAIDEMREVTEADVGQLAAAAECGYLFRSIISKLTEQPKREDLTADWDAYRSVLRRCRDMIGESNPSPEWEMLK